MRPTAATRVSARTAGGFTHGRAIVCRGRGRRRRAGRWAREHQPSSRRALYLDSAEMWRCARPLRYIARPAPWPTPLQAVSPRPLPFHSLFLSDSASSLFARPLPSHSLQSALFGLCLSFSRLATHFQHASYPPSRSRRPCGGLSRLLLRSQQE